MKKKTSTPMARVPQGGKELERFIESFDRYHDTALKKIPFKNLQGKVQPPHQRINYSRHTAYYRRGALPEPLYGWELEIEKAPKYTDLKKLLDSTLGPEQYYVTTDGSLRDSGLEIVSLPFTRYEWMSKYHQLHKLLTGLSKRGCRSHDVETCGLHIAVSGDIFAAERWEGLRAYIEQQQAFFRVISRRQKFNYCEFHDEGSQKYRALNLSSLAQYGGNEETSRAEFRFFRGTLKPRSFLASLECIFALVDYWDYRLNRSKPSSAYLKTTNDFKKFISKGRYQNLQDYLFELTLLAKPSNRASGERLLAAANKREAEKATPPRPPTDEGSLWTYLEPLPASRLSNMSYREIMERRAAEDRRHRNALRNPFLTLSVDDPVEEF